MKSEWRRSEPSATLSQHYFLCVFFWGVFRLCCVLGNTSQLTLWCVRCDFSLILLCHTKSECFNPYRLFYCFAQMWRTYAMVRKTEMGHCARSVFFHSTLCVSFARNASYRCWFASFSVNFIFLIRMCRCVRPNWFLLSMLRKCFFKFHFQLNSFLVSIFNEGNDSAISLICLRLSFFIMEGFEARSHSGFFSHSRSPVSLLVELDRATDSSYYMICQCTHACCDFRP